MWKNILLKTITYEGQCDIKQVDVRSLKMYKANY